MALKEDYLHYKKQYELPSYEELNKEFELLYVNKVIQIDYPLRFIRRRISDRIAMICALIQGILQPNPSSFINLQESSYYKTEEKKDMQKLLKKLMVFERTSLVLDTTLDEKQDAAFIKDSHAYWKSQREALIIIFTTLKEGWEEEEKEGAHQEKTNEHYFG